MTGPEIRRPTPAQIAAADPEASVWVAANAGSGKTGVLTDRVARLLLAGAAPGRILCLTYTKAAAAEMQSRLFALLGSWAMAEDARLGAALAAIEGRGSPETDPARLAEARRLFARALETPGGLKIQTIHAFCDALLRRFPLEAGVSPRFEVMDDRQAARLVGAVRGAMAADAEAGREAAFDLAAARLNEGGIDALIRAVLARREDFAGPPVAPRLAAVFGHAATDTPDAAAARALSGLDAGRMALFAERLEVYGGTTERAIAPALRAALALADDEPGRALDALAGAVLTAKGEPRGRGFPTKAVTKAEPDAPALAADLSARAEAGLAARRAIAAAARARDLDSFARAFLARYEAAKAARGLLDFHDLVARTRTLLTRADMAAWVLYKLDCGLDHILVDEAQDTAPDQWQVIEAISAEFHAGLGARDGIERTVFVVGDEKQSIYSFQGAEPREFSRMRRAIGDRLSGAGRSLGAPRLDTSFRSAPGILGFVDEVFADVEGLSLSGAPVAHTAHRAGDGAVVDLWPLVEKEAAPEEPGWWEPMDALPPAHPKLRLAGTLAAEIARMLREDRLPDRADGPGRRVAPGDILVLVRRRDALARRLILALKGLGVPVAGADRLSLAAELAAKDLIALLHVLAMPRDDLSLAAVLRSPLCGVSEEALFELAHGRAGTLWQAVTESDRHRDTAGMLSDLAAQVDYLRPYELLERILIRHDGRRRLLARLGREAEDPIDELLEQAIAYERTEPPTLAGFLAWVEAADVEVKREMERGRGEVRVMTVHGAKGLEAPVVILPDTMSKPDRAQHGQRLAPARADGGEVTLWLGAKEADDPVARAARAEADAREREEHLRLLYVAMTRAGDWLILCGAGDPEKTEGTWYGLAEAAMDRAGPREIEGPAGTVRRLASGPRHPPPGAEDGPPPGAEEEPPPPRPAWLSPAAREPRRLPPAPSALLGAPPDPGRGGADPAAARSHGTAVHLVLERLADAAPAERRASADRLLAHAMPGMDAAARDAALAEAGRVLAAPFAAWLFGEGSLAEVALAIDLPGQPGRLVGRADRLIVGAGRVDIVDIKTDAAPPAAPAGVPRPYLAQLGAYARAAAAAYPGREVVAHVLWTAGPALMTLPDDAMAAALAPVTGAGPAA